MNSSDKKQKQSLKKSSESKNSQWDIRELEPKTKMSANISRSEFFKVLDQIVKPEDE